MKASILTRRQFGKSLTGIVVAFSLTPQLSWSTDANLPGNLGAAPLLDSWLRIDSDGGVTVFTGKVEIGQGILTALVQIAAEELDVGLSSIRVVSGDTTLTPNEGYTSGSRSIEAGGEALRFACAEARSVLLKNASARLGVPVDKLKVAQGVVSAPDGKHLTYGQITQSGLFHRRVEAKVEPKPASEHKIVGESVARLDIPAKVLGASVFVQDMRLPDMVFGRVVRPSGPCARLESVDVSSVKGLPGVIAVVHDGSFLGVVATREEQAISAREALSQSAKWAVAAELPESDKIHAWLKAQPSEDKVVSEKRDATAPPIAQEMAATYTKSYVAHASIGPSCAVAEMKDGKLHVWSHTQGVYPLRDDLAGVMKLDPKSVVVSHVQGAGCYGHNGADDVALDAALLARAVPGRPVKVQWMRDDEFAWEPFGSAMVMQLRAGLAADGSIVDWQHELWSNGHSTRPGVRGSSNLLAAWYLAEPFEPGPVRGGSQPAGAEDRNAVPLYAFPSQKIVRHLIKDMPLRTSALRTLGAYGNVFALECFMDELAARVGVDPVAYRLRHLSDPRGRAVIETAAAKSDWRIDSRSDGVHGRGFGFARYKNLSCYVACVADVAVDRKTGRVDVIRMVAVADAGQIINPKGLEMQIEGGVIQSASWTLKEAVTFDRSKVTARDWAGYPILTFPEIPKVEVHLLSRPTEKPLGSGEASSGPAAAAIVNAVSHALGRRIRDLPLVPGRIRTTDD
ncbi:MAG: molybdopterin cofactor-binding domain-containing protein [Syntrophobacteraceae bacterium]